MKNLARNKSIDEVHINLNIEDNDVTAAKQLLLDLPPTNKYNIVGLVRIPFFSTVR